MLAIITLLLPLFALMGCGYILARQRIADSSWIKPFSQFNYYLAFPALIFQSISQTTFSVQRDIPIVLVQVVIGVSVILCTYAITRWRAFPVPMRNLYSIGIYFSNAGYIGIPALSLVFGQHAAGEGAVIVMVMLVITLTLGIGLLEKSKQNTVSVKTLMINIAKNVLLWSAIVGVLISVTGIILPTGLLTIIKYLAAAAVPTVLVELGIFLALNKPTSSAWRWASGLAIWKMIIIPLVLTVVYWLLPDNDWFMTTYIQASMPVALTTFALTDIYPIDKQVTNTAIALSTLMSLVTLPLVMWLATVL